MPAGCPRTRLAPAALAAALLAGAAWPAPASARTAPASPSPAPSSGAPSAPAANGTATARSIPAAEAGFGIDRYLNIRAATGPVLAPGGERIAFKTNVTGVDQVWVLAAPGAWPEQVTFGDEPISTLEWSPADASRILFGKDVGGNERQQLYLADLSTGKTRRLTTADTAIHTPGGWSRDGRFLAWQTNERNAAFFDVAVADLRTGAVRAVYRQDGTNMPAGFSPDGRRLLIGRIEAPFDNDLLVLDLGAGGDPATEATLLTPHTGQARYTDACWNPDGSGFWLRSDEGREFLALAYMDLAAARQGGRNALRFLEPTAEWDVEDIDVSDDGRWLAEAIDADGISELRLRKLPDGRPVRVDGLPRGVISGLDFSGDGRRLVFALSHAQGPSEIWSVETATGHVQQWSRSSTAGISSGSFVPAELVHWKSFDGRSISGFLYRPQGSPGRPTPVLMSVHGGPEAQERPQFSVLNQYLVNRGIAVLAPNVRGSTGYGRVFTHLDDAELRLDSVKDLVEARRWLVESGTAPEGKVAVMGGSYGGYMTLAAVAFHPDLWACGVDIVGISNFRSFIANTGAWRRNLRVAEYGDPDRIGEFLDRASPLNAAGRITAPLMVIQGANDPRVPQSEAEQIVASVRQRNGTVEYLLFPDEGHGLKKLPNRIRGYSAMADFLETHLLGKAPATGAALAARDVRAPAAAPAAPPSAAPASAAVEASGKGRSAKGRPPERSAPRQERVAVIETPLGRIAFRFFETEAPGHTAAITELIRRGFYDGTTFHRVIPGFVIQGGDPNSKDDDRSNDGEGDASANLKAEFQESLHYRPGTVGMARGDDPDSGSCQFFIALTDIPRLDGRYTIFGELVEGLDVARRIAEVPRDLADNPLARIPMTVRLETRRLATEAVSRAEGPGTGEFLTGPGKPKPFDPGNALWAAPRAGPAAARAAGDDAAPSGAAAVRLEWAVDETGKVLDVRFPRLDTPGAEKLRAAALGRVFEPARYDGQPRKVRFEMNSDGTEVGPPTGGGAPVEVAGDVLPPLPAVRVEVPQGGPVPEKPLRLRLTIDATGRVVDAAPQGSTGQPTLDEAARKAALALAVSPARKAPAPGRPPEPVAVYVELDATFSAAP